MSPISTASGNPVDLRGVRSILSVPAHDHPKVSKARTRGADLIMWDLEDSVPFPEKFRALCTTSRELRPGDMVRVNHPSSLTFDLDARTLARSGVRLVMIPKVESLADLIRAREAFGPDVGLVPCLESPRGIILLPSILSQTTPLAGLAFGPADFISSSPHGSTDLLDHAALQVSLVAAALGIHATDGPCYNLTSDTELVVSVGRSRRQGFNSKCAIHPSQIAAIREGMGPTSEELHSARWILGQAEDAGVRKLGSSVVAPPTVRAARRIIELDADANT